MARLFWDMVSTRNVAVWDRWLRLLPALLVAALWWPGVIGGAGAVASAVLAAMLVLTSVSGSCSIYYLLGFSTCPARK